jgi:predicted MFS family arabinose efflux permease
MAVSDPFAAGRHDAVLQAARERRAEHIRGWLCWRGRATQTATEAQGGPALPMVFLPLACGYMLSYVFRTINGPLADQLILRFGLDASWLGLLTSMYFLAFALSAIPIGMALDAYGPRAVQACLMTVAALGALVFALAPSAPYLMIGRALIGFGVAAGLMAGLKAHALWVSPRHLPLANGGLVMFGGFGAIAATLPVGVVDSHIGWRGTFLVLAAISMAIAMSVFVWVPRHSVSGERLSGHHMMRGFLDAITDWRFLRMAPLSASVVGTAFALHGLWAARWLTDVDRLKPSGVLDGLLAMGVGLTLGALAIGAAATGLTRVGLSATKIFGGFCATFIALQLVIEFNAAAPATLLWGLMGACGGMTVLSYSILDEMFHPTVIGRANSALNVMHLTTAWFVQAGMGIIVAQWPASSAGHYPVMAYRIAFTLPLILQVAGLVWFLGSRPSGRTVSRLDAEEHAVAD